MVNLKLFRRKKDQQFLNSFSFDDSSSTGSSNFDEEASSRDYVMDEVYSSGTESNVSFGKSPSSASGWESESTGISSPSSDMSSDSEVDGDDASNFTDSTGGISPRTADSGATNKNFNRITGNKKSHVNSPDSKLAAEDVVPNYSIQRIFGDMAEKTSYQLKKTQSELSNIGSNMFTPSKILTELLSTTNEKENGENSRNKRDEEDEEEHMEEDMEVKKEPVVDTSTSKSPRFLKARKFRNQRKQKQQQLSIEKKNPTVATARRTYNPASSTTASCSNESDNLAPVARYRTSMKSPAANHQVGINPNSPLNEDIAPVARIRNPLRARRQKNLNKQREVNIQEEVAVEVDYDEQSKKEVLEQKGVVAFILDSLQGEAIKQEESPKTGIEPTTYSIPKTSVMSPPRLSNSDAIKSPHGKSPKRMKSIFRKSPQNANKSQMISNSPRNTHAPSLTINTENVNQPTKSSSPSMIPVKIKAMFLGTEREAIFKQDKSSKTLTASSNACPNRTPQSVRDSTSPTLPTSTSNHLSIKSMLRKNKEKQKLAMLRKELAETEPTKDRREVVEVAEEPNGVSGQVQTFFSDFLHSPVAAAESQPNPGNPQANCEELKSPRTPKLSNITPKAISLHEKKLIQEAKKMAKVKRIVMERAERQIARAEGQLQKAVKVENLEASSSLLTEWKSKKDEIFFDADWSQLDPYSTQSPSADVLSPSPLQMTPPVHDTPRKKKKKEKKNVKSEKEAKLAQHEIDYLKNLLEENDKHRKQLERELEIANYQIETMTITIDDSGSGSATDSKSSRMSRTVEELNWDDRDMLLSITPTNKTRKLKKNIVKRYIGPR
eukprot:CAMPEP_0194100206 /NCGR_PEP_ID=MMETSP0150-20130528/1153_1 /TAXON_ID=122233 /ORGANISM="Chaetoceros debilis, Strain MM31A-1" /LENGTH=834 /DNA_ID=CAMNT_0038786541 /DNA_START=46 /DNA_END=2550 /DNA_ORIENTATION=+